MKVLIFGDIHGQFNAASSHYDAVMQTYKYLDIDLLIQVGDYGFWPRTTSKPWLRTFDHPCVFIDGNHEDHEVLQSEDCVELCNPEWTKMFEAWEYMPRGAIFNGILFIGGARSIDAMHRIRGVDWFPEENISHSEEKYIFEAIDAYGPENIHTVVSHDCPGSFDVSEACSYTGVEIIDGNRKFLEAVRQYVRPERWYFGHYHKKMEDTVDNTYWRCVDMIRHNGLNDFVYVELPPLRKNNS